MSRGNFRPPYFDIAAYDSVAFAFLSLFLPLLSPFVFVSNNYLFISNRVTCRTVNKRLFFINRNEKETRSRKRKTFLFIYLGFFSLFIGRLLCIAATMVFCSLGWRTFFFVRVFLEYFFILAHIESRHTGC